MATCPEAGPGADGDEGVFMLADSVTMQAPGELMWRFGSFVLWEKQRRLERQGQLVRLGSRSFDLLLQLLKRAGEVISNQELLAAVWSGVVVEEASVRVHMSILRKALGAPEPQDACREWISNVPLRGYLFAGRVQREFPDGARRGAFTPTAPSPPDVLPSSAKTRREPLQKAGLVGFVELASLPSQDTMRSTLASAPGTSVHAQGTTQWTIQCLSGQDIVVLASDGTPAIEPLSALLAGLLAFIQTKAASHTVPVVSSCEWGQGGEAMPRESN